MVTPSRVSFIALLYLLLPGTAGAQVPTASLPVDDDDGPAPGPARSDPRGPVPAPSGTATATPPTTLGPSIPTPSQPLPVPTARLSAPSNAPQVGAGASPERNPQAIEELPSALVPSVPRPAAAAVKVNISLGEPNSTVYVFPYRDDPDGYPAESALGQCNQKCTLELPLGHYSLRVVTSDGVRSHTDLELRSSRWITVAPARQVARDLGFIAGATGTVSVVLGVALFGKLICDTNCSAAARNTGGAIALGIGIPLTAIGWSLYAIHRGASIEDRIVTRDARIPRWQFGLNGMPRGLALGASFVF